MSLNLDAIRNRLQNLQNQGQRSQGGQRKATIWKPTVGKQTIRIVPSAFEIFNPEEINPFKELELYYGIGDKTMISPTCFGKKDPIKEFVKQLRSSYDKESYALSKKLEPKMRIYVPVIVRGEESEGVRLWNFGKQIYMELLSMMEDEDIGNFTDIVTGRDLNLVTVGPETTGTGYAQTTIRARVNATPLSEDKTQLQTWLKDQPNPMEIFKAMEFDEMKSVLQRWLAPEEAEDTISSEPAVAFDSEEPAFVAPAATASPFTLEGQGKKPESKASKFESLFSDDDDLPF